MLEMTTVAGAEGITIADVACGHRKGPGEPEEQTAGHALVFVRRGCFVRRVEGRSHLLDPTLAYCVNPGEEQRYDHPHDHGDDCTALLLSPEVAGSVWGGEPDLPRMPLATQPALDLEHRLLLAGCRRGGDRHAMVEKALSLVTSALARQDPARVASGRPATRKRREALVTAAREALAADLDRPLTELARDLCVSPHHLSRMFRQITGETIARHRMRLRARLALERLSGGERDLGWLSADLGFADQSHLCRVLRGETGETPGALRSALAA